MNTTFVLNRTTATWNVINSLNWFIEQELEWGCFHYVTLAYVIPVNCVIGFCENIINLCVLYHMKNGVGKSSRLYYMLLAIFNLCNIILLYLANGWPTIGLRFATRGKFFLSVMIYYEWACKIFQPLFMPTDVLLMWTYVLLNSERVVAISSPLRAKSVFTLRRNLLYVSIVGALGVALMIYSMTVENIVYSPDVIGEIQCLPSSSSLTNMIIYEFCTNIGIFTLPPALSLLLGILLFFVIKRQMAARSHLLKGTSQSNVTSSSSSATTGGIVVLIMAFVHSSLTLPAGTFGCFFFMYAVYILYNLLSYTLL